MNAKLIEGGLIVTILVVMGSAFAQTWTKNNALSSNQEWAAVTTSANGIKILAAGTVTRPAISDDSGITWQRSSNSATITHVAASADGTKLIAAAHSFTVQLFVSGDSGSNWVKTGSLASPYWNSVAISADGTKLFGEITNGLIYVSTDFGTNWTATGAPTAEWVHMTASADGLKLAAVAQNDGIYTSTNMGATWAKSAQSNKWYSIASAADGNQLLASGESGTYLSTNSGVPGHWRTQTLGTWLPRLMGKN